MLVWLDLETTGLNPLTDDVLEVGAIITDDNLNEVGRYSAVLHDGYAEYIVRHFSYIEYRKLEGEARARELAILMRKTGYSAAVLEMHWANGLWLASEASTAGYGVIDEELASFIANFGHRVDTEGNLVLPQLAGSTISFDRGFLRGRKHVGFEKTLGALHYRNLDVSTLNEIARRRWPGLYDSRPKNEVKAHRGLADVEESLAVLKHYLENLAPVK